MTKHEQHMKLIDDVNNANTRLEHSAAYWTLHGWRDGMAFSGNAVDLCSADLTQIERGNKSRSMTCGIFHDWKPKDEAYATNPPQSMPNPSPCGINTGNRDSKLSAEQG